MLLHRRQVLLLLLLLALAAGAGLDVAHRDAHNLAGRSVLHHAVVQLLRGRARHRAGDVQSTVATGGATDGVEGPPTAGRLRQQGVLEPEDRKALRELAGGAVHAALGPGCVGCHGHFPDCGAGEEF